MTKVTGEGQGDWGGARQGGYRKKPARGGSALDIDDTPMELLRRFRGGKDDFRELPGGKDDVRELPWGDFGAV